MIGKVIGLEIQCTQVPDFEIVSRLEKLVEAHQVRAICDMFHDMVVPLSN